jgi:RNA polymerase-binding transcription factor DksA
MAAPFHQFARLTDDASAYHVEQFSHELTAARDDMARKERDRDNVQAAIKAVTCQIAAVDVSAFRVKLGGLKAELMRAESITRDTHLVVAKLRGSRSLAAQPRQDVSSRIQAAIDAANAQIESATTTASAAIPAALKALEELDPNRLAAARQAKLAQVVAAKARISGLEARLHHLRALCEAPSETAGVKRPAQAAANEVPKVSRRDAAEDDEPGLIRARTQLDAAEAALAQLQVHRDELRRQSAISVQAARAALDGGRKKLRELNDKTVAAEHALKAAVSRHHQAVGDGTVVQCSRCGNNVPSDGNEAV